jgi:hypothetical protein
VSCERRPLPAEAFWESLQTLQVGARWEYAFEGDDEYRSTISLELVKRGTKGDVLKFLLHRTRSDRSLWWKVLDGHLVWREDDPEGTVRDRFRFLRLDSPGTPATRDPRPHKDSLWSRASCTALEWYQVRAGTFRNVLSVKIEHTLEPGGGVECQRVDQLHLAPHVGLLKYEINPGRGGDWKMELVSCELGR